MKVAVLRPNLIQLFSVATAAMQPWGKGTNIPLPWGAPKTGTPPLLGAAHARIAQVHQHWTAGFDCPLVCYIKHLWQTYSSIYFCRLVYVKYLISIILLISLLPTQWIATDDIFFITSKKMTHKGSNLQVVVSSALFYFIFLFIKIWSSFILQ